MGQKSFCILLSPQSLLHPRVKMCLRSIPEACECVFNHYTWVSEIVKDKYLYSCIYILFYFFRKMSSME